MTYPSQSDLENLRKQQSDMLQGIYSKQPEMAKGITSSIEPVGYNLSPLVACLEPMWEKYNIFVKKFPRVGPAQGMVGTKAQWWQINSVTNGMSSSYEGSLGSENTTITELIEKSYKTTALYDYVTYEAQAAGTGFMDAKGTSVIRALRKFRQKEEFKIIGGNINALTTPSTIAAVGGGNGYISAGSYSVKVSAVTAEMLQCVAVNQNIGGLVLPPYLDANGNAISGRYWGVGLPSSDTSVTVDTNAGSIAVSITPTPDAPAYAIFVKLSTDSYYTLQAVTTYSLFTITNYYTLNSVAPTIEGSNDILSYDGLIPQIINSGNIFGSDNGYNQLTAAETGVAEINTVLQNIFNAYRVAATNIYVSGSLREVITQANIKKGAVYNLIQTGELDDLTIGRITGTYIHPATGEPLAIQTHPYLPEGMVLITTERVDMPELGVNQLFEMHIGQDYFERDVFQQNRRYPFEIFTYSVLGLRTPKYNAIIKNCAKGLSS